MKLQWVQVGGRWYNATRTDDYSVPIMWMVRRLETHDPNKIPMRYVESLIESDNPDPAIAIQKAIARQSWA